MTGWTQKFNFGGVEIEKYKSSSTRFDASGNKIDEVIFKETGGIQIQKTFGDNGRLLEEIHYNSDGTLNFRYVYKYDEAGNEIEKEMYLKNDFLHGKWVIKRNSSGKIIEEAWLDRKNEEEITDKYEYYKNGKIVKKIRGNVADWTYSYDEKGNLISINGGYYSADETDNADFKYNEQGLLIEKIQFYSPEKIKTITIYEYSNGNFKKK